MAGAVVAWGVRQKACPCDCDHIRFKIEDILLEEPQENWCINLCATNMAGFVTVA